MLTAGALNVECANRFSIRKKSRVVPEAWCRSMVGRTEARFMDRSVLVHALTLLECNPAQGRIAIPPRNSDGAPGPMWASQTQSHMSKNVPEGRSSLLRMEKIHGGD